jgi:shikimate kinase
MTATSHGWPSALAEPVRALGARHLVLLGLPGAGKSTIGPLVARALGREFVDLDAAIEARVGRTVREIFASAGEAGFRQAERALTVDLLAPGRPLLVLAPGGGWVEDPAHRERLGDAAAAVYLRVSVPLALERMGAAVQARPLLAGADPAGKLDELLRRREAFYLQAEYTLSVESMSPEAAASSIVALASGSRPD